MLELSCSVRTVASPLRVNDPSTVSKLTRDGSLNEPYTILKGRPVNELIDTRHGLLTRIHKGQ